METNSKVIKSWTLEQFKTAHSITSLALFESKSGNIYACNKADGAFVGMCSKDFNAKKPIMVFNMSSEETGETWLFIANGQPKESVGTI